jgi:hypothetical protein
MPKTHPHAEASYRVLTLDDGSFGVEVSIPDSHPTTITKFDSQNAAEAWISAHQDRVQNQSQSGQSFRKSWRHRQQPR